MSSPAMSSDDQDHLTLNVNGMHCQSCVSMIRKTVRKLPGVESVSVDLDKSMVEVKGDSLAVRREMITQAIERMGYDVVQSDTLTTVPTDSAHVSDR
jgi:copper ion binding protein